MALILPVLSGRCENECAGPGVVGRGQALKRRKCTEVGQSGVGVLPSRGGFEAAQMYRGAILLVPGPESGHEGEGINFTGTAGAMWSIRISRTALGSEAVGADPGPPEVARSEAARPDPAVARPAFPW